MSRPCSVCALQQPKRERIKRLRREGMQLRDISAELAADGITVGKDAINRHLRYCVADLDPPPADADDRALTVATVVRSNLLRWPALAERTAQDLADLALLPEAKIIQSASLDSYKRPLADAGAGTARRLLEGEVLATSVAAVLRQLGPAHERVALAIADECAARGGDDLAAAFRDLATQTQTRPAGQAGTVPAGRTTSTTTEEQT